ncbi:MAG TPA: rhomboid family intramembrane serine protease [Tepidisphaeraceae bacterium]|jgi:membrane associated rhomboid family serine protease
MIIPLRTDSRLHSTPYMNWALIAANVLAFVFVQHFSTAGGHWGFDFRVVNRRLTTALELSPDVPDVKTFITYAFMHGGFMHLLGNMLFLYIFGNNVNDKMGHAGYLAFYLSGAVLSGIAFILMESHHQGVIGASGAVASVTGAYLVLFPRSNVTIVYFWYFFGKYELPSLWFILFFFIKDIVLNSFNFGPAENVAHAAHIGGTIFGFTLCVILLALRLLPRDQFDLVAVIKQWNRRRQYRDMVRGGYNPFDSTPRQRPGQPPPPPDPRQEHIMNVRGAILDAIARHDIPTAAELYLQLIAADPQQVLPKQAQLDVANQLAGENRYTEAAQAYETLLRVYPKTEQIEQLELMLGLIYSRYLSQYDRSMHFLQRALLRLHEESALTLARDEIKRIQPFLTPRPV